MNVRGLTWAAWAVLAGFGWCFQAAPAVAQSEPWVDLLYPDGGEILRGTAVELRFDLRQATGQQVLIELEANGVPLAFVGGGSVTPPGDGSLVSVTRTFDSTVLANAKDMYRFKVVAKLASNTTIEATNSERLSRSPVTVDNGLPTLTIPVGEQAPTLEATDPAGTPYTFHPTVSDSMDPAPTVTRDPSLAVYPVGVTAVTFTARDWAGNTATQVIDVTITDTTVPTLVLPTPPSQTLVQAVAQGVAAAGVLPTPTFSDNGTATGSLACRVFVTLRDGTGAAVAPPAGGYVCGAALPADTYFPVGATVATYRVTDASTNQVEGTYTVTVQPSGVPTLGEWAVILLACALVLLGVQRLRKPGLRPV